MNSVSMIRPLDHRGRPVERRRLGGLLGRVLHRLLGPEAELQELLCILYGIGWGFMLSVVPPAMMERTTIVRAMTSFFPETFWAIAFTGYGFVGLWAYCKRVQRVRQACALIGVFGWGLVFWFLLHAALPVLSMISVPLAALASAVSYWRLDGGAR